jgi:L-galactose dehydrogenase/L-glyceraldehyde 3-phosphate reductase
MKYRLLGRTRLKVSEIGFGCGNIGGLIIRGSFKEQLEAVRLALDLGINYFDTAPSYGDGLSETNLGHVLAELNPNVIVATKIRIGTEELKNVQNAVKRSMDMSLKRLQLDSVDIFQLHSRVAMQRDSNIWPGSISIKDVLGKNGVADAFDYLREQKLTRYIGFTGLGETKALHKIIDSERFDLVQTYFNLLNPSAGYEVPTGFKGHDFGQIITRATEHDIGVAVIRALAAGAIGGKIAREGYASPSIGSPMVPGSEYRNDEKSTQRLKFLLSSDIDNLPQAAIRFTLMHSGVSVVLIGFSNISQIKEAAACSGKDPIPESSLNQLKDIWAENF